MRVGPDQGVGERDLARAVLVAPAGHDRRQVLQVDLVDDARAGWHHAQVVEGGLGPPQELVPLAVALVLALDVEGEGAGRPVMIDLDGVVDHQVGGHERVDPGRVAAEFHDRRNAGEVLHDDPGGHERDLDGRCARGGRGARLPSCESDDVGLSDDPAAGVPENVLEQDLDRDWQTAQIRGQCGLRTAALRQSGESVEVGQSGAKRGPGPERIAGRHDASPCHEQLLGRSDDEPASWLGPRRRRARARRAWLQRAHVSVREQGAQAATCQRRWRSSLR